MPQFSDDPKAKKPTATQQIITFFVLILLIWVGCNQCNACLNEQGKQLDDLRESNPKAWRKQKLELLVDPDGSIDEVEDAAAALLKDPSSFQHVSTQYIARGDTIEVAMVFRGKNSFGALVPHSIVAKIDYDGRVYSITPME